MTNVTPEQLEEFESAFRTFDKDLNNSLDADELVGALGSLGVSEGDVTSLLADLDGATVSFEAFIRYMVEKSEDRLTPAKVRGAFRGVAGDNGFITEVDLTRLHLPPASMTFLKKHMPEIVEEGEEGEENGMERRWDYEEFLNALLEA
ncbi:hypothetical protein P7C70_g1343, partial [Phenoliferia sp. Uapishka_3]